MLYEVITCTTPYEVEASFHNAIINEVDYAWDNTDPQNIVASTTNKHHTIEGVFTTEDLVVCEGYAKAFQLLMNACDIPTIYVVSADHAFT